jgi:hypothetical protein
VPARPRLARQTGKVYPRLSPTARSIGHRTKRGVVRAAFAGRLSTRDLTTLDKNEVSIDAARIADAVGVPLLLARTLVSTPCPESWGINAARVPTENEFFFGPRGYLAIVSAEGACPEVYFRPTACQGTKKAATVGICSSEACGLIAALSLVTLSGGRQKRADLSSQDAERPIACTGGKRPRVGTIFQKPGSIASRTPRKYRPARVRPVDRGRSRNRRRRVLGARRCWSTGSAS